MILKSDLTEIGQFAKPHGIDGEITASVEPGIDLTHLRCICVDMDGIFVPFFISSIRPKGAETLLLTVDGFRDDNEVKALSNKDIFALTEDLPEGFDEDENDGGYYASDFIGWKITDNGNTIGTITDIDDSTTNVLFIVKNDDGSSLFIPVADELIDEIDPDKRIIDMDLPEGILEL